MGGQSQGHGDWPPFKRWLFAYMLIVAILAFCNRALPTSFLPLVLSADFKQPFVFIGIAMAAYPFTALLASGWASGLAISSQHILFLHSFALLSMAVATAIFGMSERCLHLFGPSAGMCIVVFFRGLQGMTAAMYLSSNTTAITRYFSDSVPYVLGMVEVAVGIGSQLGRMFGGFLFDWGGFACPFFVLSFVQLIWGLAGLTLKDEDIIRMAGVSVVEQKKLQSTGWSSYFTYRNCVALIGVLFQYFLTGFMDTALPQHLESCIGPISVSTVSVLLSIRSVSYLVFSYILAHAMHRNLLSYEAIIALGAFNCILSLLLFGQFSMVGQLITWLFADEGLFKVAVWVVQIIALVIFPLGAAALFIPALPLLQSEVRHQGNQAVEQVAQLFIVAMSLGETLGPILGGAMVSRFGFQTSTSLVASPFLFILTAASGLHISRSRAITEEHLDTILTTPLREYTGEGTARFWPGDLVDSESAYRVRCMPYVLWQQIGPPGTAPSLSFRRNFVKADERRRSSTK